MKVGNRATTALGRLEEELARVAGAPAELERPAKAEHGDYATNVALRLAGSKAATARDRCGARRRGAGAARRRARRDRPPGFLNLWLAPSWFGEAVLAEIVGAGTDFGAGSAETPERVQEMQEREPDRPHHSRCRAERRLRRFHRAPARLAGHQVEREYYYNDARTQMERFRASVEAARRGEPPPRGRLRRRLHLVPRHVRRRPGAARSMKSRRVSSARIHFDSWARQSEIEERLPELLERPDTLRQRGSCLLGKSTATGDEKDRVSSARRSEGVAHRGAADIAYLRTSWSGASTVRSTSSAPTTMAFAGGTPR